MSGPRGVDHPKSDDSINGRYARLVHAAIAGLADLDIARVEDKAREAIALKPAGREAHHLLGWARSRAGDAAGASLAYLDCMDCCLEGSDAHAENAACAFLVLITLQPTDRPQLCWWTEASLQAISARAIAPQVPGRGPSLDVAALHMRALILSRAPSVRIAWSPRLPAAEAKELREAGRCFQAAARLCDGAGRQDSGVAGLACLQEAQAIDAVEDSHAQAIASTFGRLHDDFFFGLMRTRERDSYPRQDSRYA